MIWVAVNKVELDSPRQRGRNSSAMRFRQLWQMLLLGLAVCFMAHPAPAITIQLNYAYDTSNFFGSGNPQGATGGAQAKAALEAAASYYSTILTDTFDAITVPAQYHSTKAGSTSTR